MISDLAQTVTVNLFGMVLPIKTGTHQQSRKSTSDQKTRTHVDNESHTISHADGLIAKSF